MLAVEVDEDRKQDLAGRSRDLARIPAEHAGDLVGGVERTLIRPPGNEHSGFKIGIHGIHPQMTVGIPSFGELWPMLADRMGGRPLVAHTASFDMSVLRHELDHMGLRYPDLEYYRTLVPSRACWPGLYSHRPPDVE